MLRSEQVEFLELKRAETALRQKDKQEAFLLKLSDAMRPLADPADIANTACRLLVEQIDASRAQYAVFQGDRSAEIGEILGEHVGTGGSMPRRFPLAPFGEAVLDLLRAGASLVLADSEKDPRLTPAAREAFRAVEATATVSVPLVKEGRFVAALTLHDLTPREWANAEVALVENVAERTWAAVERARAEAALVKSEEKYRTLFETMDEGFCIIEKLEAMPGKPVDFRYVEGNRPFRSMSGTPDIVGKSMREAFPREAPQAIEIYDRVLRTGESVRFEYPMPSLDRVLDLHAFRVDGADSRRVAVLFQDINERKRAERALHESEARLQRVLETDAVAVLFFRPDGLLIDANEVFLRMTGYDREDIATGRLTWQRMTPPEWHAVSQEQMDQLQVNGRIAPYEKEYLRKDGSRAWMLFAGRDLGDGTVVEFAVNIDDRKRAEAALRDSEARLAAERDVLERIVQGRSLAEVLDTLARKIEAQSDDGMLCSILLADGSGTRLLHGAAPSLPEAYNRAIDGIRIGPDAGSCGTAAYDRQPVFVSDISTDPRWADFKDLAAAHGLCSCCSTPILSGEGHLLGTIAMYYRQPHVPSAQDRELIDHATQLAVILIERKRAEAALRESESQYRNLFESIDEGFCVIEVLFDANETPVDYRFLQANPAFERQTGLVDAVGKTMLEMVPEHEKYWFEIYGRIALTGEPARFENEAAALKCWYDVYAFRVGDPKDRRVAILFRDIMERKRAEAALREQQERVRKVERLAAAGQLAASLAHEINNPLESVTNILYLLETHPEMDETAREYATVAASELARVSRIVRQSLSYYRIDRVPVSLNLGQVAKESLEIYAGKMQQAGIEVKQHIRSGSTLLGFPNELRQAIDNLLLNALQAMPQGGHLAVSVRDSSDWTRKGNSRKGVRITIADTGCGIPRDNRRRIFEPFFTTKSEKGTGLGLWVLQGIVAKHEGKIRVRSSDKPGRSGTVMSVFLPSYSRALAELKRARAAS